MILDINDLSIGYYSKRGKAACPILESFSAGLSRGRLTAMIGPNGSGKSTLIRVLGGLMRPLEGSINIDGRDLYEYSIQQRAELLSVVLTSWVAPGELSVYEIVAMGRLPYTGWQAKLKEEDHEAVRKALKESSIEHLAQRSVLQISDGERQKVMAARALAQDTPLMLLDEPTAHLDAVNRVEMIRHLQQVAHREATHRAVLFSTHEIELALKTADEVWVLDNDKQFHRGAPEDLVLDGTIEKVFHGEGYHFNEQSGNFEMSYDCTKPIVVEGGDQAALYWTLSALQRRGFYRVEPGEQDSEVPQININSGSNKYQWEVETSAQDEETVFYSVEALMDWISRD